MSEDSYWKRELQFFNKFRKYPDPFSWYYPEKKASLIRLLDYFSNFMPFENSRLLEVGMGSGMALVLAVQRGATCVGIDNSRQACKFANILKNTYLSSAQMAKLKIFSEDCVSWKASTKFDLVFNIGSLEHQRYYEQLSFLFQMKNFSKRFIAIGVPDYNSPIFKSFENYFKRINRLYEEPHLPIDVEDLFKSLKISLIDKEGIGIGISNKHINFKDKELTQFLRKVFKINELSRLEVTPDKISWLVNVEKSLLKNEKDIYGFIDLYMGEV